MALGSFTADLSKFADKVNKNYDLVVKKLVFLVFSRIVGQWPYDTTRSRTNWQIGGSLGSGVIEVAGKVPAGAVISREQGNIQGLVTRASVIGYIFNNVEYAGFLEYGWSQQAPSGAVRITLAEVEGMLSQAAAGLG
jgi:hypothetical protein